jgi:hypothetical protein
LVPTLKSGQIVRIRCQVKPGPFPDEKLIMIETDKGSISGFVRDEYLIKDQNQEYVTAKVIKVSGDAVEVRMPGTFFTIASGVTSVSPDWANTNLQLAPA